MSGRADANFQPSQLHSSSRSFHNRRNPSDQMGYVYYGNYAMYYEVARVESLRQLGLTYKELENMGVMMPVLENHSKFIAPGRYDDLLRIKTTLRTLPGVKIKFEYEIFNESNSLIHTGETLLAFVDKSTSRPCRPPQPMLDVLTP